MRSNCSNRTDFCRNPYRESRERIGLSQEAAAEALGVVVRTLWSYETNTRPSDEMVISMAEIYQDPYLEYEHLRSGVIGEKLLPSIERGSVSRSVIFYQAGINVMRSHEADMIQIAYDDRIDGDELPTWRQVQKSAMRCMGAMISLVLLPIEKVASVAAPATSREKQYHR